MMVSATTITVNQIHTNRNTSNKISAMHQPRSNIVNLLAEKSDYQIEVLLHPRKVKIGTFCRF